MLLQFSGLKLHFYLICILNAFIFMIPKFIFTKVIKGQSKSNKLNRIEPTVSAEIVREIASKLEATIRPLNSTLPDFLQGIESRFLMAM